MNFHSNEQTASITGLLQENDILFFNWRSAIFHLSLQKK